MAAVLPATIAGAQATGKRVPALDGLRGFAALYVILFHFGPASEHSTAWAARLYAGFVALGWSGVDLFFVLSGFLITGILLENLGSPSYFSSFYGRRILRIMPLYYALCFVAIVIVPHIHYLAKVNYFWVTPGDPIYYWFFLNNFYKILPIPENFPLLNATWSLAVEEQFYLVWPLLIWLLGGHRALYAIAAVFLFSLTSRLFLYFSVGVSGELVYVTSFTHLDGIAIGSMLAIAFSAPGRYARLLRALAVQMYATVPLLLIVAIYCLLSPTGLGALYVRPPMIAAGYALWALFYVGLLLNCLKGENATARFFENRLLCRFGKYSYAMYLLHLPIYYLLSALMPPFAKAVGGAWYIPDKLVLMLFAFALTYGVAAFSWYALESRVLSLKRYFPSTNPDHRG